MKYSIIIPVYNRPDEVDELLAGLVNQKIKDFEVVIVEDGSQNPCKDVVERYKDRLDICYLWKENGGPSAARNMGVEACHGEYVLILDSDCVIPEGYLTAVEAELDREPCDAFGGPDRANAAFTPLQKAVNYTMTSFFTTGGIRGGKKKLDKFYPRSFNMGMQTSVYKQLGGFSDMRFGEDIDLSYRVFENGYSCRLFPDAWVWHKRRTDFRKFFRQVVNSGIARINLTKRHPGTLKLVHMLPAAFTLGVIVLLLASLFWVYALIPLLFYALLIFCGATIQEKSLLVGVLAIPAAFVQLGGYGLGFLWAWWRRCIMREGEFGAFKKNFYK
ncbi:MAG: glycosyltransferase [Bacteroidaceae bacterium]|jgi:glycosyltransferase involved in cell wall biosynthesis|nr:glycosyltransferase [Bacteroidaceae bacterium]HAE24807.1 glycosyl transferase family 2 [Prevotellaceae bacterium]